MCWVITSTKLAVVQCESSVGGSPRTAARMTPPFFWAEASAPRTATRASASRRQAKERTGRLFIANLLSSPGAGPGAGPERAAVDRDGRGDGDLVSRRERR